MPSGVTSVMSDRVGLKLTLIDRSRASATVMATPSTASSPRLCEISPMCGSARSISAARMPPMMMNGRRRPPQNHTRSLITPISSWPMMPASGPAAHTRPISWMVEAVFGGEDPAQGRDLHRQRETHRGGRQREQDQEGRRQLALHAEHRVLPVNERLRIAAPAPRAECNRSPAVRSAGRAAQRPMQELERLVDAQAPGLFGVLGAFELPRDPVPPST